LLKNLSSSSQLCNNLLSLNISNNRFDNESSKFIGLFIGKTTALKELNISNSNPVFMEIVLRMEQCAALKIFNVSGTRLKGDEVDNLLLLIKKLPNLEELNISNTSISFEQFQRCLTTNRIKKLNISDNENADEAFIDFCVALCQNQYSLEDLDISRCLGRKSKSRNEVIESIIRLIDTLSIKKFHFGGGGKSTLRNEILPLINGIVYNKNLEYLDISSHLVGDQLAFALRKVLLHNNTLKTLHWDENETTFQGFNVFKFGLERNRVLNVMPIPLKDVYNVLKNENETERRDPLINLIKEIELLIFRNGSGVNLDEVKVTKEVTAIIIS